MQRTLPQQALSLALSVSPRQTSAYLLSIFLSRPYRWPVFECIATSCCSFRPLTRSLPLPHGTRRLQISCKVRTWYNAMYALILSLSLSSTQCNLTSCIHLKTWEHTCCELTHRKGPARKAPCVSTDYVIRVDKLCGLSTLMAQSCSNWEHS